MRGKYCFCPYCAELLQPLFIEERLRLSCPKCGWIYYRNPTVGVAVILLEEGRLLLGERRDGGWCIPCGHVEWDEDIKDAAIREFAEETGLMVILKRVYAVHSNFHNPDQHTVGIWYMGQRYGGVLRVGGDLLNIAFYPLDGLPDLKFPTDRLVAKKLSQEGLISNG